MDAAIGIQGVEAVEGVVIERERDRELVPCAVRGRPIGELDLPVLGAKLGRIKPDGEDARLARPKRPARGASADSRAGFVAEPDFVKRCDGIGVEADRGGSGVGDREVVRALSLEEDEAGGRGRDAVGGGGRRYRGQEGREGKRRHQQRGSLSHHAIVRSPSVTVNGL